MCLILSLVNNKNNPKKKQFYAKSGLFFTVIIHL